MAKANATKTTKTKVTHTQPATVPEETQFNIPGIFIAEAIGVFILTLVAIAGIQQFGVLYTGLTFTVLVIALHSISGAHLNPAITLGLWAARKIRAAVIPVYWIAHIVGALAAVLILNGISQGGYGLSFNLGEFAWSIFTIEAIAAAVLLFGVTAVASQPGIGAAARGLGYGLSFTVALVIGTVLLQQAQSTIDTSEIDVTSRESIPREFLTKGPIANPAIAIAETEYSTEDLTGGGFGDPEEDSLPSRASLDTILGALVGALIGSNLYLLARIANRRM